MQAACEGRLLYRDAYQLTDIKGDTFNRYADRLMQRMKDEVGKCYVLDANVFIGAQQNYYSLEICPGFWRALVREHEQKRVFSIDQVKAEIVTGNDPLSDWAKDRPRRRSSRRRRTRRLSTLFKTW